MEDKARKVNRPERILSYFKMEKRTLAAVAVSGIMRGIRGMMSCRRFWTSVGVSSVMSMICAGAT